jgi:hypothetical protein
LIREGLELAIEGQFSRTEGAPQTSDEFAPEHFAQHLHRQKKSLTGLHPGGLMESQSSRRNDTMNMGVLLQGLAPTMENTEEAKIGT